MHPSVIIATDKQIGMEGSGLRSTKTPRPSIATGMQRLISPYIGMFIPPSADKAKTQFAALHWNVHTAKRRQSKNTVCSIEYGRCKKDPSTRQRERNERSPTSQPQ